MHQNKKKEFPDFRHGENIHCNEEISPPPPPPKKKKKKICHFFTHIISKNRPAKNNILLSSDWLPAFSPFTLCSVIFTHKDSFTTVVAFVARVDQDQAAKNMQPDLWATLFTWVKDFRKKQPWTCSYFGHSITCIQRPPKGSNESGLLQQVVFKCRFYQVDLRRAALSAVVS